MYIHVYVYRYIYIYMCMYIYIYISYIGPYHTPIMVKQAEYHLLYKPRILTGMHIQALLYT